MLQGIEKMANKSEGGSSCDKEGLGTTGIKMVDEFENLTNEMAHERMGHNKKKSNYF